LRLFLILSLLTFFGCANNNEEKVKQAIDIAQTHLSSDKCSEAIKVLEEAGRQPNNPIYVQVLASAYACRAGYSEIDFLLDDLGTLGQNANPNDLLKTLSILSLSTETQADSTAYMDLQRAIEILIGPGTNPNHLTRVSKFGQRKAGDVSVQLLLMSIAQLGKFLHYYGNVDSNGKKAAGGGDNNCFMAYSGPALAVINGLPGGNACTNSSPPMVGHDDLATTPAAQLVLTKRRVCEGITLFTNIMDILETLDLTGNDALSSLNDVKLALAPYKAAITSVPTLSVVLNTTAPANCRAISNVTTPGNTDFQDIQHFFALIFETWLP
jgi:hypothetical protein